MEPFLLQGMPASPTFRAGVIRRFVCDPFVPPPKQSNHARHNTGKYSSLFFVLFQTVTAQVESADLVFLVSLLQQTGANIKIHNCDVTVNKLKGQVNNAVVLSCLMPG